MCAFSTSAWLYLEKAKAPLSLKLIQKECFILKTNRTLQTCWYLGVAPGILKVAWAVKTLKRIFFLMYWRFDLMWFIKLSFFYDALWAAILKPALREVDNVSFSAHACEWIGFTQLLVPKAAAAAEARSCILTSSSGLCLLQEAVIPLPCHSLWSSGHAAVFCPSYLYSVTALQMIERKRGGKWSSYLFSFKYPSCSVETVWCLDNVLLKSGNNFNY